MDERIIGCLKLLDNKDLDCKELHFQKDGKTLFLSSISNLALSQAKFDLLDHWIEESIINLPPYEKLLEILHKEGRDIKDARS
jgi:hypothetical protein